MKEQTPLRAIRAKCLDCCGGVPKEVLLCPVEMCPLFAYRFGKKAASKRYKANEERRKKLLSTRNTTQEGE